MASGRGLVVVVEDAVGRRLEIIELAAAQGPQERRHRHGGNDQGQRKHDIEHSHGSDLTRGGQSPTRQRNIRDRYELITTVIELSGISTAARSGPMSPAIASTTATRL